jgi:hypothetical protein
MRPLHRVLALARTINVNALPTPTSTALLAVVSSCAQPALLTTIHTSGCQASDAHYICSNSSLISTLTNAVESAYDLTDQAALVSFAQTSCGTSIASSGASRPMSEVSTTAGASAVAALPSSIAAPETTITLMGSLLIDTTILTRAASTTLGSMHMKSTTILYPMPTGGAFHNFELSALAFAIVGGAIGMIFVKL